MTDGVDKGPPRPVSFDAELDEEEEGAEEEREGGGEEEEGGETDEEEVEADIAKRKTAQIS